jgi:hypothetical protein
VSADQNPIASVVEWCRGVGHHGKHSLYAALVLEEAGELCDAIRTDDVMIHDSAQRAANAASKLSGLLRSRGGSLLPREALDAALDTAWVALCLAYQIVGDERVLRGAWGELHRSNITDKQVGGVFIKDETGKVCKPPGWTPPDFEQFV